MTFKKSDLAFAVAILSIGYSFLPIETPLLGKWVASIALLVIGGFIVIFAIIQKIASLLK